ncbi:hypothetical protein [Pseudomonas proteolytica]|uniref:hypothetical protein n=1 Tax=Pseudomonas proteolytica TaxID=219574 RepID=UPI0030D6D39C
MFSIKIDLLNGVCSCTVNTVKQKGDRFYFYLLKDGAIIDRLGWSDSPTYTKKLTETGNYHVQAHLKRGESNTLKRSESIFHSTEEGLNELRSLWKDTQLPIEEIALYKLAKPFSDFVLHHGPISGTTLSPEKIDKDLKLSHSKKTHTYQTNIFTFNNPCNNDSVLHFSGTSISESRLIFGSEDISKEQNLTNLLGSIGNFTTAVLQNNEITISTDYFGFGKLYYYKSPESVVISNSYHLLLIALRSSGIELEIDLDVALSKLTFVGLQPFYQNFSRRMDIQGTHCLPIDKMFVISDMGITIQNKEIAETLQKEDIPSEAEYIELLGKAKNEILENFACIAKSPRFKEIIIDVSGGMDSRLVFCAATNFPEYREKITLNSQETRDAPEELNVAIAINSCYNYPYNESAETIISPPPAQLVDGISSYYLGTYYSYNYPQTKISENQAIRLTGFGGEIAVRPYFSRLHFNTELDVSDVSKFISLYFEKYGYLSRFDKNSRFTEATKRLFKQELDIMPGSSALEKFDWHYLFYRNGLHCSDSWRVDISGAEFAILQSKSSFELKKRCFTQHKSVKLQLDLMSALNPFLATYPYESDMDNQAQKSINLTQTQPKSYIENLRPPAVADHTAWESARKNKLSKRTLKSDNYAEYKAQHQSLLESRLQRLTSALTLICGTDEELFTEVAAPIYFFAKANFKGKSSGTQFQNLYTKIMSIAYQIKISRS